MDYYCLYASENIVSSLSSGTSMTSGEETGCQQREKEVFVCFPVGTERKLNDELIKRTFKSLFV